MLNNLTIGTRLTLAFAIMVLLMTAVAFLGLRSISSFNRDLDRSLDLSLNYSAAADTARDAQVMFKRQVQEWKDILLRGHDGENFAKYKSQFNAKEDEVKALLGKLKGQLTDLKVDTDGVDNLLVVHGQLGERYRQALNAWDPKDPLSYRRVDALVKGMDREPTQKMDGLVAQVISLQKSELDKARSDSGQEAGYLEHFIQLALLLGLVMAGLLAWRITRSITRPMGQAVALADRLAVGDMTMNVETNGCDEVCRLLNSMRKLNGSMREISGLAAEIAGGNLTVSVRNRSDQDELMRALATMLVSLRDLAGEMQGASARVSSGADQISDAGQSLAQGTTEQASSLQEITASLTQITAQTKANAHNASQARDLAHSAMQTAEQGNVQMHRMVQAMTDISNAGQDIAKIISVIDDIAFQTNLLALNAAVEAAHAGQHGKGFAVVAEEVRNLAARSAKAARETRELIQGSVQKTNNGTEISRNTATALAQIVGGINQVNDLVAQIASASNQQAQGLDQIQAGLGQIDQVTQQNSANAEQSAAAAEELASQSSQLSSLLGRFRLDGQLALSA